MLVNHGLDLVLCLDSLEIIGACLSSKEERAVLYEINREPRDMIDCLRIVRRFLGEFVMSLED